MTKSDFPHPLCQIALEQSRVIRLDRAQKRRELARDVIRDLEAWRDNWPHPMTYNPDGPEGERIRREMLERGMEP